MKNVIEGSNVADYVFKLFFRSSGLFMKIIIIDIVPRDFERVNIRQ